MHALFLTEKYPPVVGGGESHIRDLAHGLVANGHQVTVLTETPAWVDSAERTGPVGFHEVPGLLAACAQLRVDTAVRSLHQALSRFPDADLLHVFNRVPALLAGLVRDRLPAAVGLSAFETVMRGKRVFGLWDDFPLEMSYSRSVAALLRPDAVVCGSRLYRSWALDEGYPPERVHTVYFGTDVAKFRPDAARRAAYRRRCGWSDEFVVLVAARPIPRKRIEDAVEAVAKGRADWPDVRLVLTAPTHRGVDSYVWDLERRIDRAGLGDRVSWLRGLSVDDMAELTRAADVSVLPAADDGFGIVLIEAMASGVPVITSDVPGHDEIVSESTGALYPLGDVDRLVDALRTASKGVDPMVVAAARDLVCARFSRERMVAGTSRSTARSSIHPGQGGTHEGTVGQPRTGDQVQLRRGPQARHRPAAPIRLAEVAAGDIPAEGDDGSLLRHPRHGPAHRGGDAAAAQAPDQPGLDAELQVASEARRE